MEDIETIYYPENESEVTRLQRFIDAEKVTKVSDGQILNIAGKEFEVIEVPNEHTPGGTALLDITDRLLLSGDTLGAQTFRGGTTISLSAIDTWVTRINELIDRLNVGSDDCRFDYIIGGHTGYLNNPEFIENLLVCLQEAQEKGMDATTTVASGQTIVVDDGRVLTSDEIQVLWADVPLDERMLTMCSITVRDDSSPGEEPGDVEQPDENNPNDNSNLNENVSNSKNQVSTTTKPAIKTSLVKTGDDMLLTTLSLAGLASIYGIIKMRKKIK